MPAKPLMSWNKSQRRWEKMYKGIRFWVTCTELGLPESQWTKEASYQVANAWWERKLAGLQAARAALHPHHERLRELAEHRDVSKALGEHADADVLDAEIVRVTALPPEYDPEDEEGTLPRGIDPQKIQTVGTGYAIGQHVPEPDGIPADIDPDTAGLLRGLRQLGIDITDPAVAVLLSRSRAVHADRTKRVTITPPDKTIGGLVKKWQGDRQDEARQKARSNENADALCRHIGKFHDFIGGSNPVDSITADVWHRWYVHCAGQVAKKDEGMREGWDSETAAKVFAIARSFVKWLWERDILANLPKNLNNKQYRFERPDKPIPTFTNHEIKTLVTHAKGVHRLILLLMLNTGMTQKDVADLRKSEIDLVQGRITRRRSKTAKKKSSRLVSYKLWKEVADLLRECINANPDEPRALVTKSGQPWVWTEMTDCGKLKKSDNVATVFNNLKRKIGMNPKDKGVKREAGKSLKVFRKTSPTRLKGSKDHKDMRAWFLGHSEGKITDRNYSASTQEQLDAAVDWLRTQYDLS